MKLYNTKEFIKLPNPVLYIGMRNLPEHDCDIFDGGNIYIKTYSYEFNEDDEYFYFISCSLLDLSLDYWQGFEILNTLKKGIDIPISVLETSKDYAEKDELFLVFTESDIKKLKSVLNEF